MMIHNIQQLLLANGGAIIDHIKEDQISEYQYLKSRLHEVDVSEDEDFQDRFKNLHKFKLNRITKAIQQRFFEVLEGQKAQEELDAVEISQHLFGIHMKGKYRAKHFSLVTTLMHYLDDTWPIYEIGIGELLGFDDPDTNTKPAYQKLNAYTEFYEQLTKLYDELLEGKQVYNLLKVLDIKFKAYKDVLTPHKRMDLLFRAAGELTRKNNLLQPARIPAFSAY
ncbi:MAG: hypothetical protein D6730_02925 [Bacteroidetes bacterium]|nr:MAG: hypothetical protein D6730_02925 [Bacteroidota bacterium]